MDVHVSANVYRQGCSHIFAYILASARILSPLVHIFALSAKLAPLACRSTLARTLQGWHLTRHEAGSMPAGQGTGTSGWRHSVGEGRHAGPSRHRHRRSHRSATSSPAARGVGQGAGDARDARIAGRMCGLCGGRLRGEWRDGPRGGASTSGVVEVRAVEVSMRLKVAFGSRASSVLARRTPQSVRSSREDRHLLRSRRSRHAVQRIRPVRVEQ